MTKCKCIEFECLDGDWYRPRPPLIVDPTEDVDRELASLRTENAR